MHNTAGAGSLAHTHNYPPPPLERPSNCINFRITFFPDTQLSLAFPPGYKTTAEPCQRRYDSRKVASNTHSDLTVSLYLGTQGAENAMLQGDDKARRVSYGSLVIPVQTIALQYGIH